MASFVVPLPMLAAAAATMPITMPLLMYVKRSSASIFSDDQEIAK